MRDMTRHERQALDNWITREPDCIGCEEHTLEPWALIETFDPEGEPSGERLEPLTEWPMLAQVDETGAYTLARLSFSFADGSELVVTRQALDSGRFGADNDPIFETVDDTEGGL